MTSDPGDAADPLQNHVEAVEQLARLIAGPDEARFNLVFQALLNQVDGFLTRPGSDGVDHARSMLRQTAEPYLAGSRQRGRTRRAAPSALGVDSLQTDPVYLQNSRKLIASRDKIVGGVPTSDFPECVAVGSRQGWCCSGTLVASNVVITAAHCLPDCAERVFVGEDVDLPDDGHVVDVRRAVVHPDYPPHGPYNDLAVLVLAHDVPDVAPRRIVDPARMAEAFAVRLAGYGNTDPFGSSGYGRRRMVDVPIASSDHRFGAEPTREFVAGAPFLDRDSCNGDSGGPAYVEIDGEWALAGATSRATVSSVRPCGDGGIYTLVPAYLDWVRAVEGGHWD